MKKIIKLIKNLKTKPQLYEQSASVFLEPYLDNKNPYFNEDLICLDYNFLVSNIKETEFSDLSHPFTSENYANEFFNLNDKKIFTNSNNIEYTKKIIEDLSVAYNICETLNKLDLKFECFLTGGAIRDLTYNRAEKIKDLDIFFHFCTDNKQNIDINKIVKEKLISIDELKQNNYWQATNEEERLQKIIQIVCQRYKFNNKFEKSKTDFDSNNESYKEIKTIGLYGGKFNFENDYVFIYDKENSNLSFYINNCFDLSGSKNYTVIFNNKKELINMPVTINNIYNRTYFFTDFLASMKYNTFFINLAGKNNEQIINCVDKHIKNIYDKYQNMKYVFFDRNDEDIINNKNVHLANTIFEKNLLNNIENNNYKKGSYKI